MVHLRFPLSTVSQMWAKFDTLLQKRQSKIKRLILLVIEVGISHVNFKWQLQQLEINDFNRL